MFYFIVLLRETVDEIKSHIALYQEPLQIFSYLANIVVSIIDKTLIKDRKIEVI